MKISDYTTRKPIDPSEGYRARNTSHIGCGQGHRRFQINNFIFIFCHRIAIIQYEDREAVTKAIAFNKNKIRFTAVDLKVRHFDEAITCISCCSLVSPQCSCSSIVNSIFPHLFTGSPHRAASQE